MQSARFFIAAAGTLFTLVDGSPVNQCSSSTTSSIGSISGYTFEGCFTEASSKRALTGKSLIDDSITIEKCSSFCSNYNFFGLENGRECYCGNALMAGSVPTRLSECSFACPGNNKESCGAVSRLNIYSKISSSSVSGSVSVASEPNSGSSQGSSSGHGGSTSSGSTSENGNSSSESGNTASNSDSNPSTGSPSLESPSTGSSNGNGQDTPHQGSGNDNTSPGNDVTTKSPPVVPGGPSSTNIIVPSAYPWSNATTKATFSTTSPTLSRPGTGVLPSPTTISAEPLNSISSSTLPTLSRPGTGVFPSPSTISVKHVNSTTISTLYPTASASSTFLASNTSSSTTVLETTVSSTSVLATQSTEIPVTFVTSSSVPTITIEPSSSLSSLEYSTLSTIISTSSLDETSVTSAPEPTTIASSTIDLSSSSTTLDSLTTSTEISTSSLDEATTTSIPEPTTIITSTIEPTSLPDITSTLTTLVPVPSSTIEPTTSSDPVSTSIPSSAPPASTNLIRDGDFEALSESSTIPWVVKYSSPFLTYNFENPTAQATAYGARSASITLTQALGPLVWFNQPLTLSPNTVYNFSANTKASALTPGCALYYYIGSNDGTATTILAQIPLVGTNWSTNTGTYTSTSVTDVTINVRLICPAYAGVARTFFFDNISLVPATAVVPAPTPV